jgi:hypothetical protein
MHRPAASDSRSPAYLLRITTTRSPVSQENDMKSPNRKLALAVVATLAAATGHASSHREAPAITRTPAVDATDFYLFNSYEPGRSGYVTVIANYLPLQDAYGGPNYFALDDDALYEILIDNNGDAREDLTFQFRFHSRLGNGGKGLALDVGDETVAVPLKNIGPVSAQDRSFLNFREYYTLKLVRGDRRDGNSSPIIRSSDGSTNFGKPYDFVGTKTFGSVAGYEQYARRFIHDIAIPGCQSPGRVFVGQRDEPFAVNLGRIFDLVNLVPVDGSAFPGGIQQDPANDTIADKNITTLALELPKRCLVGKGNGVIGGWTAASVRKSVVSNAPVRDDGAVTATGPWVQVSRLSNPLVNEVVIGLPDKDAFNASEPRGDAQFATYVTNPTLPALIDVLFRDAVNATLGTNISNLAPSNLPRTDLVTAFLTGFQGVNQQATVRAAEMVRLNTAIAATPAAQQSTFGVAGGDLAGFPNGRRPGDDVVDLALRVVMGRLCHPLTIGGNSVDLGLCQPAAAPIGLAPLTDGAPVSSADFDTAFPYLRTPFPGSGS